MLICEPRVVHGMDGDITMVGCMWMRGRCGSGGEDESDKRYTDSREGQYYVDRYQPLDDVEYRCYIVPVYSKVRGRLPPDPQISVHPAQSTTKGRL